MPTNTASYFDLMRQGGAGMGAPASAGRTGYLEALTQPTPSAAPQVTPAVSAQSPAAGPPKYSPASVAAEMSGGEQLLAGVGRGLSNVWSGVKQLGLEAGGLVGIDTQDALNRQAREEASNKQLFDTGLGKTGFGKAGEVVGETLPYLVIPAGPVGRAAGLAGKMAVGAGIGAGIGATQYVNPGESRLGNIGSGALAGGITSGALDLVGTGAGKVYNALANKMTPRAEEVMALGKKFDVPVYAPDVAASPTMNKLSTLSEEVPLLGMARPRLEQAEAAKGAANALVNRLAPPVNDVGREIQGSLSRRTDALQQAARVRYDRVAQVADPLGEVPLANMRATAQKLLNEAKKDIDPNSALISRLENFVTAKNGNFSQTRQFRSNLGDSIRQLETSMDLKAARPLQMIKSSLENDMNGFAQQAGGDVATRWREADRFFREKVVPQRESDIVKAARNRNPDEVFRQFIKAGTQDRAQRLYNALDRPGRDAVKAGILQQALDKATLEGSKGVAFSPAKFAGDLEKLQGSVGVFFKGADKAEIDGFTKLMRHIERAGQVAENPPTGNRVVLPLLMGETLAPGTSFAAAGTAGLSRLLFTTDAGKRLLLASNRLGYGSPLLQRAIDDFSTRVAPALAASQEIGKPRATSTATAVGR